MGLASAAQRKVAVDALKEKKGCEEARILQLNTVYDVCNTGEN